MHTTPRINASASTSAALDLIVIASTKFGNLTYSSQRSFSPSSLLTLTFFLSHTRTSGFIISVKKEMGPLSIEITADV